MFRVTGAYVLVAWIVMQAGEIVFPAFELPNRALRLLILFLVAGLPVVVVLAWLLDVTPRGIRITARFHLSESEDAMPDPTGESPEPTGALGRSLEMILLGMGIPLFAFAALFIALTWRGGDTHPAPPTPALAPPPVPAGPSLAVLPLEDLSTGGDDAGFFAHGMHEDILTHLARVQHLKLISRTSVLGYEGTTKSARQIGRELGVGHVLEGSVRRTPTHVRVTAQLIHSESDEHVWADQFDAELEDVFAVQTHIARAIARALEAELVTPTASPSETSGSVVPAAYDAYLKARDLHRSLDAGDRVALQKTQRLYEEARHLDERLAAAWLQLGILHAEIRWFGFDPSAERAALARHCLDRARELGVEDDRLALAEGIFAYYVDSDFGKALLRFDDAARRAPGNSEAHFYRAMILRRSGALDAALDAQRVALELDPLNLAQQDEYALTLALADHLHEAREELIEILHKDPDRRRARLHKWQLDLELEGSPKALLSEILAADRSSWRDPDYALLETVAILANDPQAAYDAVLARPLPHTDPGHRSYQLARLAGMAGRAGERARLLTVARSQFEGLLTSAPDAFPEPERRRIRALFALQEHDYETALDLQRQLAEAVPIERDLVVGAAPLWDLLHAELVADRPVDAARTLERLDSRVALGSIPFGGYYVLTHWPEYTHARQSPTFTAALERLRPDYSLGWKVRD